MRQNLGDLGHQNALRIDTCHLISQICRQILLKQVPKLLALKFFFFFFLESLFSTWKEWACFLLTVKREVSSDSVFLNKTNCVFFFFLSKVTEGWGRWRRGTVKRVGTRRSTAKIFALKPFISLFIFCLPPTPNCLYSPWSGKELDLTERLRTKHRAQRLLKFTGVCCVCHVSIT